MGLVVKLKKNQRLFLDDLIIEVCFEKGRFKMYITGPKPLPYKIRREDLEQYRKRVNTYQGDKNARGVHNLHEVCKPSCTG